MMTRDRLSPAEVLAWRETHQLTQAELAEMLGLRSGAVTVSSWENGRSTPQPYLILALEALERRLEARRSDLELAQHRLFDDL
jgi:DNA-binding transcriptional regulator YiaG